MAVRGTGVPGSGWSHLGFWIGVVAPWFLEPPHCSLDVAQVPVPRATPPSHFEAWPKAAASLVLGPAVMSEGPSSPKGESTAFSRVGFPGSREASSHPCRRLQEREVPSTGRREGVSGGLPLPAHPPPASPRRPVATFISAARGQYWFPTMSQLAARNGRPLSPGRGAGPPLPEGPGAGRPLWTRCWGLLGALLAKNVREGRCASGRGRKPRQCLADARLYRDGPVLLPSSQSSRTIVSTWHRGASPTPLLENCSPNSYRRFSEVSCPVGDLSPSFLGQPVFLLSVRVRRLSGTPIWPAPKLPIAKLKVLCPQPFPCGS